MAATLVLGGTGFLGAHVVVAAGRAAAAGGGTEPAVYGVGRRPEQAPRFAARAESVAWEACDLAERGAARRLLERLAPAAVIHCAALARVGDCAADPALAYRINAELPAEVAAWCAAAGARLVHVSTDLVFGAEPAPPGGFDEAARPAPVSVYGESKLEGERRVLAAHPGALIARLPLLYGDSGGRGLGASDSLLAAIERGERPALFTDEYRTPLEVGAAAEALVELATGEFAGVLHVAGPDRVSRHELGLLVLAAAGFDPAGALERVRPSRRSDVPSTGPRPADVSLDARRAAALSSAPLPGVAEGTRRAARGDARRP